MEDYLVTLEKIKYLLRWMLFISGQKFRLMLRKLLRSARYVGMLKEGAKIHDCISHYQYHTDCGMQLAWILF